MIRLCVVLVSLSVRFKMIVRLFSPVRLVVMFISVGLSGGLASIQCPSIKVVLSGQERQSFVLGPSQVEQSLEQLLQVFRVEFRKKPS